MYEGIVGEIRGFAGSFAPLNWAYCGGQLIPIAQYTSVFAILGTTYGGNGTTNFALPNLQNRVAIGAGLQAGTGLTLRSLGDTGGSDTVTLNLNQIPAHSSNIGGSVSLSVNSNPATDNAPSNTMAFGQSSVPNTNLYQYNMASPDIALNAATVAINVASVTNGNNVGGNQPHDNHQPYLGVNYIICLSGIFPSRP